MRTKEEFKMLQALPLDIKIAKTQARIREWVNHYGVDGVYVSFSGGKDSTVLLDIARRMYPDIEAVFVDTGLEYPEIRKFVKTFENVTILRPKMRFDDVIKQYGYPFISKNISKMLYEAKKGVNWAVQAINGIDNRDGSISQYRLDRFAKWKDLLNIDFNISDRCCGIMKEKPLKEYGKQKNKVPLIAIMAEESQRREDSWIKTGCNAFDTKEPKSKPLSIWTEQDILKFIQENNMTIASVYGDIVYRDKLGMKYQEMLCDCGNKLCTTGCNRTGCIFCQFGSHLVRKGEESRLQMLKRTHPKQYEYCMNGGEYDEQGLWIPNSKGLGMKHCIDVINSIYGKDFIKY